ncbi:MAG: hydroxyethylthiazole kinase [Oligosphaeraceae bacterium]|nr:hydroxyethylthiazole kinase [Oligosphaeraceae bacterium]
MSYKFLGQILSLVRARRPLVHQITNYVTVNACANATLAIGASPIMAHAPEEMEEMVSLAQALLLNIGTPDENSYKAMLLAGRAANTRNIPVLLDPVGAGATAYRTKISENLLHELRIAVVRGNQSEIRALLRLSSETRGVDSVTDQADFSAVAATAARKFNCVVAATGEVDYISDGKKCLAIYNQHALLQKVTGTGCMCTALAACCVAAAPQQPLEAACTGVAISGLAGEIAAAKIAPALGTGSFHTELMNAFAEMNPGTLQEKTRLKWV